MFFSDNHAHATTKDFSMMQGPKNLRVWLHVPQCLTADNMYLFGFKLLYATTGDSKTCVQAWPELCQFALICFHAAGKSSNLQCCRLTFASSCGGCIPAVASPVAMLDIIYSHCKLGLYVLPWHRECKLGSSLHSWKFMVIANSRKWSSAFLRFENIWRFSVEYWGLQKTFWQLTEQTGVCLAVWLHDDLESISHSCWLWGRQEGHILDVIPYSSEDSV